MQWSMAARLSEKLTRLISHETVDIPGVRWIAQPLYRRLFKRPAIGRNAYYGLYSSYEQALADVPAGAPGTYDTSAATKMYRNRLDNIRVSDYPVVYWLSRLLPGGVREVFDLGGHIGVTYYGLSRYLDYPSDLRWIIHDVPAVMQAGREWALEHDPQRRLEFAASSDAASGRDLLFTAGALQYLDYTLPELIEALPKPPRHVLVNMVPMHPSRSFFTLQNLGVATCPYRIAAVPEFIDAMHALGYEVIDRWESFERQLRIPFTEGVAVDRYYGFYFRRTDASHDDANP